jgi:hypothetical protein
VAAELILVGGRADGWTDGSKTWFKKLLSAAQEILFEFL